MFLIDFKNRAGTYKKNNGTDTSMYFISLKTEASVVVALSRSAV